MSGYILLHRKLRKHWVWTDAEKLKAWLDILMQVNHDGKKVLIGEKIITCKRGESCNSMTTWAKRWGWTRSKTRRFLSRLKSESMVDFKTDSKTTYLTVCNYNTYQNGRTSNEHQMNIKRTSNEHQMNTNKELIKNNKELKEYKSDFIFLQKRWEMVVTLYPNLNDIQSAIKVWNQLKPSEQLAMEIIEAIKTQKESGQLQFNKYCPLLKNWLGNERWKDQQKRPEFEYDDVLKFVDDGEDMKNYKRLENGRWIRL